MGKTIIFRHFRNALGAIIVYDITKERSFRSVSSWLLNLKQKVDSSVVVMMVGNKLDIAESDFEARRVEYDKVVEFQKNNGIFGFVETSANYPYEKVSEILKTIVLGN